MSGTLPVKAAPSNGAVLGHVDFYVDNTYIGTSGQAPFSVDWDTRDIALGRHTLTGFAVDAAGNASSSPGVAVTVASSTSRDRTPPTVSLTAPAPKAVVSGATVSVTASATDNAAVAEVDFLLDGNQIGPILAPPWSTTWDSTTAPNGAHTLTALAYDSSRNLSVTSIAVSVNNPPFTDGGVPTLMTPPTVAITSPRPSATLSGTTQLTAAAAATGAHPTDEQLGVTEVDFYVDGAYVGLANKSPYSLSLDTTFLGNGAHSLTALVLDFQSNIVVSSQVNVVISN